jgi:probable HAF family extracellular repeat protein
MKRFNPRLNLSLLCNTLTGLALLSLTGGSALAANWTVTDLGALGAPSSVSYESRAYSINNAGQVAGKGVVLIDGVLQNHYVVWSNGTQIDLGIRIISSVVDAAPINNAGQVAGVIGEESYRPFLWQTGVVTRLPSLPGTTITRVYGINAGGKVVGYNRIPWGGGLAYESVLWQGGTVTDLHLPYGHIVTAINNSDALAIFINYSGQRSYVLSGSSSNVVEWPGLPVGSGTGALDLNNAGQVCGWFTSEGGVGLHAFLWPGGAGAPLPEFPYGGSSAVALNNLGHAVGYAYRAASDNPAVLWRDGILTCLNDLPEVVAAGWTGLTARDLNDHDQIVGFGYHGGPLTAFLLSPVTAPSSFSLTITRSGTNVLVSFPTAAGFSYNLQSKVSLTDTNWNLRATIPGNGSTQFHTDPATNAARFYRVVVP